MKFRINHERASFFLMIFVMMFSLIITYKLIGMDFTSIPVLAEACLLFLFVFFAIIDRMVGTTITVNDNYILIQQLFHSRRVSYGEILSVDIKNYTRSRTRYGGDTFRMKMTIRTATGNDIILNDNASKVNIRLTSIMADDLPRIPDEEVNLYKAYMMIKPRVKGPIVSSY